MKKAPESIVGVKSRDVDDPSAIWWAQVTVPAQLADAMDAWLQERERALRIEIADLNSKCRQLEDEKRVWQEIAKGERSRSEASQARLVDLQRPTFIAWVMRLFGR